MTVSINALGHEFTVGSVAVQVDTDTQLNVIKRREEIVYRSSVPASAVNVAFLGGKSVSSDENLSIADRSTSLAANRVRDINFTTISNSKTFSINTENFVVTDVFVDQTETLTPLPLFFQHVLSDSNVPRDVDGNLDTGVTLLEIQILDVFLNPVKVSQKKIDYTKGILYNNLEAEYNNTGDYTAYYVKYIISNNGEVTTYLDLLDNETVYKIASFDDLTATMQIKTDGRKVYLIDEVFSGFSVTLPVLGTYAFQPLSASRIEINPPVSSSIEDSWFVRVSNGTFFTNVAGGLRKYYIAEFLSQVFSPEPPIKSVQLENSTVLSKQLIKLDRENINEDGDLGLYVSIMINDADGNGLQAYTTDSSIVGNIASNGQPWVQWNNTSRVGIRSIDHKTGYVAIDGFPLKTSYEIVSNYFYNEDKYEFTLVNFNPISNREALSTRLTLFIDPDTISTSSDQTLYFLKSDETGRVIESNWPDFDNDTQQWTVSGVNMYYENFPAWKPSEPHVLFVEDFTVEGDSGGDFLILGDITVAPASHPSELSKIDSRRRGGGIIDTQIDEVEAENPEVAWYWDRGYWDGTPYPGNASYMVEVPVDVLQNAGGAFLQSEVKDVVNKHTAFGVYPVSKAYGVDIAVSGVYPGADTVTLEWTSDEY